MPDAADQLRDAMHAVDREPFVAAPSPVIRRARRRLGRNAAITAVIGVVVAVSVGIGALRPGDAMRTTPADPDVSHVPAGGCCLPPAESLLYQAPDGSIGYDRIDGQRGGTVLAAARALASTPDSSRLLEVTSDGVLGIYAGRRDVTPIVRTGRSFEGASIAPDGRRVAIATGGQLIQRTVGRAGSRVLVPVEVGPVLRNPAWSPDGRRIAYIRSASGNDLMILNVATGETRLVLPSVAYAAWSPDGTRLAIARPAPDFNYEVDVIDLQGHVATMAATPAVGFPAWSPDGSRIAFIRSDGAVVIVGADGADEIARSFPAVDRSFTTLLWVRGQSG